MGFVDKIRKEIGRVQADGGPAGEPSALGAAFEANKIFVGVVRGEFGNNWVTNTASKAFVGLTNAVASFVDGRTKKQEGSKPSPEELTALGAVISENFAQKNFDVANVGLRGEGNSR